MRRGNLLSNVTFWSVSVGVCPNMTTFDTRGHTLPQESEHSMVDVKNSSGDKTPLILPLKQLVVKKGTAVLTFFFLHSCSYYSNPPHRPRHMLNNVAVENITVLL